MNVMDKIEFYRKEATNWMNENREWHKLTALTVKEFSHACDLAASVIMTRDNIMHGGSFVQAVIENNLDAAVSRADDTAIKVLHAMVSIKRNCWPAAYVNEMTSKDA